MKNLQKVAVLLVLAALLTLPTLAAEASPATGHQTSLWAWFTDLPSTVAAGWASIWDQAGSSVDPNGAPVPGLHPTGDAGAQLIPDGAQAPLGSVIQPAGPRIDPDGQPAPSVAGEGDIGPMIDPMG